MTPSPGLQTLSFSMLDSLAAIPVSDNTKTTHKIDDGFDDLGFSPERVVEEGRKGETQGGVGEGKGPSVDVEELIRTLPDISYMISTPAVSHF